MDTDTIRYHHYYLPVHQSVHLSVYLIIHIYLYINLSSIHAAVISAPTIYENIYISETDQI